MPISRQRYIFDAAGTYYLDLWRNTSLQERKMFRQMPTCQVMGGLIKDADDASVVRFNVAPATWVTKAAIKRGFKLWNKMNYQALEGGVVNKPKYHDFKMKLNPAMSGSNIKFPVDAAGIELPRDGASWDYAQYHSEDVAWNQANLASSQNRNADSFGVHIVGDHTHGAAGTTGDIWHSVGLIQSWFDSRPQQNPDGEPIIPAAMAADPLVNLFDETDVVDEVITSLDTMNDTPPYDVNEAFGNASTSEELAAYNFAAAWGGNNFSAEHANLQRVAFAATQSGAGQIAAVNGFSATCGLVQVHISHLAGGNNQVELILDVNTKGVPL